MEICSKSRLLVLVVLLLGLVVTTAAPAYGSKVEEVSSADAENKAGETQWNVESWTDWAKEKLRVVTDTASKESDANTKDAKGAASKAGDTASVYWEALRSRYNAARDGVNKFTQGGYEYVKKSGNEAYGTAKATVDKAYETAAGGTTSGKTKESEAATSGAGKISQPSGVFESTKQKLGEQYEAAKEAANEQITVASKLAGDVGQHVKHLAGAGHEEL
ncbi:unnamed protein product [Sphagnum jensenii]|uniref:Late embryogenesis abundant protein D-29 n=1 Tax=Sphagnum jensenii TaxID=128206 RepID=A0ABP0X0S7_9BRYO